MSDSHSYPDALPPGHRIGNYEIQDVLGRGGFGITYRALQLGLERTVAIKEYLPRGFAVRAADGNVQPISPEEARDYKRGLERYLKEAKTLAQLDHPSIVRVYEYFEAHETGYIVMDYIEGETLEDKLRKIKPNIIDTKELKRILDPLMDGLEIVHKTGILHRDIKPNNIMIRESGTPVLIDFGAARDTSSTHTQTMIGTPRYAAPEQMPGHGKQGTWTDIYGLSAVVFRCITGLPPQDAVERLLSDRVVTDLAAAKTGVLKGLVIAAESGLALKPEKRPQTIKEWRDIARGVPQVTVESDQHRLPKRGKSTYALMFQPLIKYISGRASRREFGFFLVPMFSIYIVISIMTEFNLILLFCFVMLCIPVMVRRSHDLDESGWWAILPLPFMLLTTIGEYASGPKGGLYAIWLITWVMSMSLLIFGFGVHFFRLLFDKGTSEHNRFGPDPLTPKS